MYKRRRKFPPTAAEIANALEKVREARRSSLPLASGNGKPLPEVFDVAGWVKRAPRDVLDLPGTALMIAAWVLELGGGPAINQALAQRWGLSEHGARERLILLCQECGWLMEALLGGHARRHQDRARLARFSFRTEGRTGPEAPEAPPA